MNPAVAQEILDKIIGQVFGYKNPLSLEQFVAKFAFDVKLPQQVFDTTTNEPTWASSVNPTKFITFKNTLNAPESFWEKPKRPINSIQDVLAYWNETNHMATERVLDSINVTESDNVRSSENIYRAQDIGSSKNILFSETISDCEFIASSQRSVGSTFCVRLEDSKECTNSFNVSWSGRVSNSFFIQDCSNIQDCMFCSHMTSKQYYIANMPFEKEEYFKIKDMVVRWILTG
jgi:hypothetical protein